MEIIHCNYEAHARQILDIFNEQILNSTALYEYQPRSMDNMVSWFEKKEKGHFPIVGVVNEQGRLMGFASYGTFRDWPAYQYTVEHSVYVHPDFRGQGLGVVLMKQLIEEARRQQYHVMIGGIDASNPASIAMHKKLGFTHAGTLKQVGFKFERWLDLDFYHLFLN